MKHASFARHDCDDSSVQRQYTMIRSMTTVYRALALQNVPSLSFLNFRGLHVQADARCRNSQEASASCNSDPHTASSKETSNGLLPSSWQSQPAYWSSSSKDTTTSRMTTASPKLSKMTTAIAKLQRSINKTSSSNLEQRSYHPAQVTAAIAKAGSLQRLLQLLQQHAATASPIHVGAAFARLAALSSEPSADAPNQQPAVQQVLQQLQQLLTPELSSNCSSRELSTMIWACAQLRDQATMAVLLPALTNEQVLHAAKPAELSIALWAAAKMGLQLQEQQLAKLCTAFVEKMTEVEYPQNISNMLWAVATMKQQMPDEQLQQLLAALVRLLPEAAPQAICNTLKAVAVMHRQVSEDQLREMLAYFVEKLPDIKPQEISSLLWAVATMGQQVPAQQLRKILTAFIQVLLEAATPQDVSNTLWAVATMGQQVPADQLPTLLEASVRMLPQSTSQVIANTMWAVSAMQQQQQRQQQASPKDGQVPFWVRAGPLLDSFVPPLLDVFTARLQEAKAQEVSNVLLACGRFGYLPEQLLATLDSQQELLQHLLPSTNAQDLTNAVWACGVLGYRGKQLPGALLQHAVQRLHEKSTEAFTRQGLSNLCWAVAVLDLQQHVSVVLQLAQAYSQQYSSTAADVSTPSEQQLYQVHLWLLDVGMPSKDQGLSGVLSQQHLEYCKASWEKTLEVRKTSQLHQSVFAAMQQLPACMWEEPPAVEQRTADGAYSIDIAATTATGERVAIEVDGPYHFSRPHQALKGPTQCRNRALAARGYRVISIPYWEWTAVQNAQQQQQHYLMSLL